MVCVKCIKKGSDPNHQQLVSSDSCARVLGHSRQQHSLVEHCRLLFETRCRLVKPLLLRLFRSSGRCAFSGVQGCVGPPLLASPLRAALCQQEQVHQRRRATSGGGETFQASGSITVWGTPRRKTNASSMWTFETAALIATYGIFPCVVKLSHFNTLHFKVFAYFNPELFDSTQTLYPLPFHH